MKTKRSGPWRPREANVSRKEEWSAVSNTAGGPVRWGPRADHWIYTLHVTGGAEGMETWMGQLKIEWEPVFMVALFFGSTSCYLWAYISLNKN